MFVRPRRTRVGIVPALVTLGAWVLASTAYADAIVAVTLKSPSGEAADGTVTLVDAHGKAVASCEAKHGACEMKNVAGGKYSVTVKPVKGEAPKPRKVMIPPSGKVTLVVTSG